MNPFINSNQPTVDAEMKRIAIRAGLTGTALAVASTLVYGSGDVAVMGKSIPAAVPLFAAGAIGSVIADKTHQAVADAVPMIGERLGDLTGMVIGGAICAGASAGTLKLGFDLPRENLPQAAALGFASYAAADYAEKTIGAPIEKMIF